MYHIRYMRLSITILIFIGFSCRPLITTAQLVDTSHQELHLHQGFFGHMYFDKGHKMKNEAVHSLLKEYPHQLKEYNKGSKMRLVGNVLAGVGVGGLIASASASKGKQWGDMNTLEKTGLLGFTSLGITGVILSITGDRKVIWSFKNYSAEICEKEGLHALIDDDLFTMSRGKLKKKEIRKLMHDSPEALKYFNSSVKTNTLGGVIGLTSFVGLMAMAADSDNHNGFDNLSTASKVGIIGSSASFVGGLILLGIGKSKRMKAISTFYTDCDECLVMNNINKQKRPSFLTVGYTDSGVGFVYNF